MSQLMIKQGQLHNFAWNVYIDGCGTLMGRNGETVQQQGENGVWVFQPSQQDSAGDGLAFHSRRLVLLLAVSAPRFRDLPHRAGDSQPQRGVEVLPSWWAGKYSITLCFIQLLHLQAWVSAKETQTSCLNVLIYVFKSTQYAHNRAESPGLNYKYHTKLHQD